MSKWEEKRLGDICKIGDGAHASLKRVDSGVLYLTAKNITPNGLNLSQVELISEETYNKHFNKNSKALTTPQANDILYSIIGSIGGCYIVKEEKIGISSSVAIFRCNLNYIIPKYLFYFMRSEHYNNIMLSIKSGVAQGFMSLSKLSSIKIRYPDLPTQEHIAGILSTYDDLIENNNRRIELLEKAAQELYKEWFVRFRFPNHENTKFVNGLPEEWEVKKLSDYGQVETGKTPSTAISENYGDDIMFVKTPDMHGNVYIVETLEMISEKGHLTQPKKLLPTNSIMVSCIGTGGVVAINSQPAHTNQQINSIVLNDQKYLEWLYFTCKSLKPTIELFGATGATMTNLSKGKFEKLKAINPPQDLIYLYNEKTNEMLFLIKELMLKNQNLKKQRDLLLPRLMSGKLEV